ncbi:MAG: hypothetical protein JWP88_1990 [Flaviaesturariibacter sp.]|nr:hypothetical protein [Flaviaesturariibacter sp.]
MAEIIVSNHTKGRQSVGRHLKIDMTPLVDLAFLLITFFIFTTSMTDRKGMKLVMPKEGPSIPLGESNALTLLLGDNNKVYAYTGDWKNAQKARAIKETSYSESTGIGAIIRAKQQQLRSERKDPAGLMVLIKASDVSTYKNTVDALDEMLINGVTKYTTVDMSPEERATLFPHS